MFVSLTYWQHKRIIYYKFVKFCGGLFLCLCLGYCMGYGELYKWYIIYLCCVPEYCETCYLIHIPSSTQSNCLTSRTRKQLQYNMPCELLRYSGKLLHISCTLAEICHNNYRANIFLCIYIYNIIVLVVFKWSNNLPNQLNL